MWVKSTYQKRFNQNIYLGENLAGTVVIYFGHASLKRERIFHWIAIFCHCQNYSHVENNNEANKEEQNIHLNPKKNLSMERPSK